MLYETTKSTNNRFNEFSIHSENPSASNILPKYSNNCPYGTKRCKMGSRGQLSKTDL